MPVRLVASIDPAIDVLLHLRDAKQAATEFVEYHGGQVMVQQSPPTLSVGTAPKKDLEGIVPGHPDSAPTGMAQQMIELGSPLGMRGAT